MVMRCSSETTLVYELFDDEGRTLGRILLPKDQMIIGPQAGTVLLRRELPLVYSRFEASGGPPARAA
jgi:hypothetical protein